MELLSRLRSAVKKLTFLLNLKKYLSLQSTWRLASFMRARAPAAITGRRRWRRRRAMSFNDRPGLRACVDLDTTNHEYDYIYDDGDDQDEGQGSRSGGSSSATSPYSLRRAVSCPPEDEDVDKRSEMFIENFYRQLQYERQISLDLRYCQGNSNNYSFKSSSESVVSPLSSVGSQLLSPT